MLTPKKHLDLNTSLLRVASILLVELEKKGIADMERLRNLVVRRAGSDSELNFIPALGFLYAMGRIEYHEKNDTIEFKAE